MFFQLTNDHFMRCNLTLCERYFMLLLKPRWLLRAANLADKINVALNISYLLQQGEVIST